MTTLAVSQVNDYIKQLLDEDAMLGELSVRGELSNYKRYPSGHHYFTMKDAGGSLKCVMFRGSASRLRFTPQDGMQVIAFGRISVYPRDGVYQLYCTGMTPEGVGDLHVAYEQLKEKLQGEGLFDLSHKKPLPAFPHRIAIVTSAAGAAVRDMLRILAKRYPLSRVYLLPVRVQGTEAPPEIAAAIAYANRLNMADVLITGRGGGSIEDLWAFNDEQVARAIFASRIPVVSAVGHEPDVTISDFVADLRAATPSNAAELVAPDQEDLRLRLDALQNRMAAALSKRLHGERKRLEALAASGVLQSPEGYVVQRRAALEHLKKQLFLLQTHRLAEKRAQLTRRAATLDAISPLKVLGRGYALVQTHAGQIVRSAGQVQVGEQVQIRLGSGSLDAEIQTVREEQP